MSAEEDGDRRLLEVIGGLYDAAADPSLWPAAAGRLGRLFLSESCLLLSADGMGRTRLLGVTDALAEKAWRVCQAYYFPQGRGVIGNPHNFGRAIIGHEVTSADWHRSGEFLNHLREGLGIFDVIGATIPLDKGCVAILGVHRTAGQPRFDEGDKARLDILIPHLRRAVQLTLRLENAGLDHQAALEGLERAHSATIVADLSGLILFATRLAALLLERGEELRSVNGRLMGVDRRVAERLSHLIRGAASRSTGLAAGTHGGGLSIEREDGRAPLTVLVASFRARRGAFGAPAPAALVFIRDPETPSIASDILQDLFGLTRAQAAVAARLGGGECLEDIAAALRITRHTANDHLKVIFSKTGCRRQPQLAALLSRTVATLGDGSEPDGARLAG